MKLRILLIAIALAVTCNTLNAQIIMAYRHILEYAQNPDLAYNQVEISGGWTTADFYHELPAERPVNVPADCVLVQVFFRIGNDDLVWLGWVYLDATRVNRLHQGPTL